MANSDLKVQFDTEKKTVNFYDDRKRGLDIVLDHESLTFELYEGEKLIEAAHLGVMELTVEKITSILNERSLKTLAEEDRRRGEEPLEDK